MPTAKITKQTVDALRAGDKDQYLWDRDLAGFGVKITPAGRRVYLVQYRIGGQGGRVRRVTIGKHGPVTPDEARREAKQILGDIAGGKDPAENKTNKRNAMSVTALAGRFIAEHVTPKKKSRTVHEYQRLIDRVILPSLGSRKVIDVKRQDIAKLHHSQRATPYQANRTLAVLSKMFNLAEAWGERPDGSNPCRHIEKFKEEKRERFLSADELSRLGETLAESKASPYTVAAIKLLIFTGARLNEILALRWDWINWEQEEARLPDSKTGAKTLHLPAPAMAVLASLPRVEGNPHVIIGHVTGASLVNLEKPWLAIRKAAGLDNVRLHDLRHAFASVAASSGMGLPIIGKILGHTQAQTTARYAHLASDPVKAAANTVAGKIAEAMNAPARATSGELVEFPKRKT